MKIVYYIINLIIDIEIRWRQCVTFVRRVTKAQRQAPERVCSAINLVVSNNFTLHAHKLVDYCVKRLATIWTTSNTVAIVNIITANW